MNKDNERYELVMKAVVDMNGDWKTGIQNTRISSSNAECIFSDNRGYWATMSSWRELCLGERASEGDLTPICTIAEFEQAAIKWREQQYVVTPKVNYEELTFGELPHDEKLKLIEYVLDGGKIEGFFTSMFKWEPASTEGIHFCNDVKYRVKKVEPLTEKELFLMEAKHYESIEQMFDSGKFKLVDGHGEE